MDVDVALLVEVVGNTQRAGTLATTDKRGLDRLLHHLAELAGGDRLALARQHDRFDGQQLAANFGPRQTGHLTDLVLALGHAEAVAPHAEELVEVARI
jgi:hypothetical protein